MNRGTLRKSQKLIGKSRFPLPEFSKFVRNYTELNPEVFIQCVSIDQVNTNLSGEVKIITLSELYHQLSDLSEKVKTEKEFWKWNLNWTA